MALRSIAVEGSRVRGRSREDLSLDSRLVDEPGERSDSGLGAERGSEESPSGLFLSLSVSPSSLGFAGGGSPPMETGVAAPRFVAGAIAAMWLAYMMYVPALAARAPEGA